MESSAESDGEDRLSLLELARLAIVRQRVDELSDVRRALATAARVGAASLPVARVGVWKLQDDRHSLLRVALYDAGADGAVPKDLVLPLAGWPAYLEAVLCRRVVAANDARTDPRTRELRTEYLEPNNISSMLDAPLFLNGEVWGVVCHEHVGAPRSWTPREIDFASSMADMLSSMLEQSLRLALEERLRVMAGEVAKARQAEAVTKTAAAIGHDVNTVLQAISARAQRALHGSPTDPGSLLHGIVDDCQRAARVLGQLRDLHEPGTRLGAESDLGFVIDDLKPTLLGLLQPDHQLELDVGANLSVSASRADLERVLLNLVVNAREAQRAGGPITVRAHDADDGVVLQVRDRGHGITPEHAARVFEPYFTTKDGRHSGLGLFAVQAIARRTGGEVSIGNAPGGGTIVTVRWPGPKSRA